ncbi:L-seryl-tRNA(Sec) selenium transferase [Chloroflexota bacterium]
MVSGFRRLPSVDKVLSDERIKQLEETYPHDLLVELIRQSLGEARLSITAGNRPPSIDEVVESVCQQIKVLESPTLRTVVNATGVILHTNLGRAPLSQEARAAMDAAADGYCNLEFDLATGRRGSRQAHIEPILCQLTGAEAGLVVNNNASAVLLGLTALARRKEVIVSRGQAVEIGGGFRIPDVMRQSGAKLVEVGTTNCTYAADYEQAINSRTAALMRVHSSNFRLVGFTNFVTLEELVSLGQRCALPVLDDLGSGCFLDTTVFALDPEPMVQQSVASGAGLVFFSGDKLVGGPQAGVIIGKKRLIDRLKRHPLARAVRIDKVRLAGLRATMIHYLKNEATTKIPVWRMISAPLADIERRATMWAQALGGLAGVIEGESVVGGGSLPGGTLPTRLVAIGGEGKKKGQNIAQVLSGRLRAQETPVVGRVSDNILLLDPRSVLPEEDDIVLQALRNVAASLHLV